MSPVADIVALGNDSPMGPGFAIYGEHTWGGHADARHRPGPQRRRRARPAARWEECAAYPLASLTAYRMLRRARLAAGQTVLVVGIGSACRAPRWRSPATSAPRSSPRAAARPSASEALAMGAAAAIDSAAERWAVQADVVVESVGPATWDAVGAGAQAGRPARRVRRHVGAEGRRSTCPALFFKQFEIIGSSMGSYQEFAELTRADGQGLAVHIDEVFALADYPAALARLEAGEQLGKIVLRH